MYFNELCHYGVKGMKWGVRMDTVFGSKKKRVRSKQKNNLSKAQKAKKIADNIGFGIGVGVPALALGTSLIALYAPDSSKVKAAAREGAAFMFKAATAQEMFKTAATNSAKKYAQRGADFVKNRLDPRNITITNDSGEVLKKYRGRVNVRNAFDSLK